MRNRQAGLSLMELLVVMAALMVVMAMGFEILGGSTRSVSRGLSLSSRGDRVRFLQRRVDRDLASRYGTSATSPFIISSVSETNAPAELLRTQILQEEEDRVEIVEVVYSVQEQPPESGKYRVYRGVDPDLTPGEGADVDSVALFTLGPTESLIWEAVSGPSGAKPVGTWLRLGIKDKRHEAWLSERRMLMVGY